MGFASAIASQIGRLGATVVWVRRQGDICPCTEEGSAGGRFYPSWHDANPTEPHCDGLGIINIETTRSEFKAVFCPPSEASAWDIEIVGEYKEDDHVLIAPPSASLEDYSSETDELVIDNETWTLLWKRKYLHRDTEIFTYGLARGAESKEGILFA